MIPEHRKIKEDLDKNLTINKTVNFSDIQNTFIAVLHKYTPIKTKSSDLIIVVSCPKAQKKQLCIDQN